MSVLRGGGLEIVSASGGAEGIAAMSQKSFDAVVLGSNLEDLGGDEFIQRMGSLKGDGVRPPVIRLIQAKGCSTTLRRIWLTL